MGTDSLRFCTTGKRNTTIGYNAGQNLTTANNSTLIGEGCAGSATTGANNTGVGRACYEALSTGYNNSAVGEEALEDLTTGNDNIAMGYAAGLLATTGANNVFLGSFAGSNVTTGTNNILLGQGSQTPNAVDNNQIVLGNSSHSHLRCQVSTISSLSDERDKTNILDLTEGLNIINLLKPRRFTWAMREESANNGKTEIGFIAQELDTVFGDKNDYIKIVDKSNTDKLAVAQGKLIPILVKAIQELSAEVELLKAA